MFAKVGSGASQASPWSHLVWSVERRAESIQVSKYADFKPSKCTTGKPLETAPTGQNHGKYSLENALMLKAYAGMQTLKEDVHAKMH